MFRLWLIVLAVTAFARAAFAADAVAVRTGGHDGYTRIVFEWPAPVSHTVTQAGPGALKISFGRAGEIGAGGIEASGSIKGARRDSADGAALVMELSVLEGSTFRDFASGSKVIVDVYDPKDATEKKAASVKPPPAPQTGPPPSSPPETKAESPPPAPAGETPAAAPADAAAAPPEPAVKADVLAVPDTITLSSTEAIGVAAFRRGEWLWIVADKEGLTVPPASSNGGGKVFEEVPLKGGTAWRARLPRDAGIKISGEGGGLLWRIALGNEAAPADETPLKRLEGKAGAGVSILWPSDSAGAVVTVRDPETGDSVRAVTVSRAGAYSGAPYDYVDFETLPSAIGMAVLPRADGLEVARVKQGIQIAMPGGLHLSSADDMGRVQLETVGQQAQAPRPDTGGMRRLFDFDRWSMGGIQALNRNQTIMLSGIKTKGIDARIQDLITLAKMNLANDRGPEALGFLNIVTDEMPAMLDNAEFIALRGASEAVSGKYELAFKDLGMPTLNDYSELDYWRAFALAGLEDWRQAASVLPKDVGVLLSYPEPLLERLAPKLSEIALRDGNVDKARTILGALGKDGGDLAPWTAAALDYLKGQADRQSGQADEAVKLWTGLLTGTDDLFRVRAGLALTMLEQEKGSITPDQAIDRLEGLRYAWRGDELEAQINFMLGKLYMERRQYMKAFTILRDAAGMSPDSDIARDIDAYMHSEFYDLLMNDKTISPIEAVTVYQEFQDLAPGGDPGNKLVQRLAERLVTTDLLGRAGDLLQKQVDYDLQGQEQADVALRLASIALVNKDPERAIAALDKAQDYYAKLPDGTPEKDKRLRAIALFRARALSQLGKPEDAITLLSKLGPAQDVSRLRADIAWRAALWPDAGEALHDLMADQGLDALASFDDRQAQLVLNRAVALNLAGDRVELANMRERYGDRMKKTARGNLFEVVTRPHSINVMAEQQTIQGIVGEIDMFRDFLNDYKAVTGNEDKAP